jgi:IclR family transcriptional regulator, acetate operon repressor
VPKNRTLTSGVREVTGPRSLTRVLGLFDVLAKTKDGLTLAELNMALRSPKSSLLNLLRPLVADGYLNYENGRYRLGAAIFRLAGSIVAVWNFSSAFRPYLEELALRSQESVYMGVLDRAGKNITYVDAIESPQSVRFTVPVGAVRPLYSTAAGRVLLAYVEPAWREEYLSSTKLQAFTPKTIKSRTALREELERIRQTGVSVSLGEMFAESAAISSPIFGSDGWSPAYVNSNRSSSSWPRVVRGPRGAARRQSRRSQRRRSQLCVSAPLLRLQRHAPHPWRADRRSRWWPVAFSQALSWVRLSTTNELRRRF